MTLKDLITKYGDEKQAFNKACEYEIEALLDMENDEALDSKYSNRFLEYATKEDYFLDEELENLNSSYKNEIMKQIAKDVITKATPFEYLLRLGAEVLISSYGIKDERIKKLIKAKLI